LVAEKDAEIQRLTQALTDNEIEIRRRLQIMRGYKPGQIVKVFFTTPKFIIKIQLVNQMI
jgi:hypothetical protein